MRAAGVRSPPPCRPLGRVALALAASFLIHGVVLAAALFLRTERPPEPGRAVFVELVADVAGAADDRPPGGPSAPQADAAPALSRDTPAAGAPVPPPAAPAAPARAPAARAATLEPEPRRVERPPRERSTSSAPKPRQPPRMAAIPPPDATNAPAPPSVVAAAGGAAGPGGSAAAVEPSASGGAALGEGEPPGFAPGSADNPLPHYPIAARRRGIEGSLVLDVLVTPEGSPRAVAVARSSGSALLDEAALEAVRRWRFRPARRGNEPVEGRVSVPIAFRLVSAERAVLP